MTAPCFNTPGNRRLIVARRDAREKAAWIGLRLRINAELPPFLSNHGAGTGHRRPRFTFYQQRNREGRAVGFHPLVTAFFIPGPLEKFGRDLGIGLPPPSPECGRYFLRVLWDLVSHRGPQRVGNLLRDGGVI